MKQEQHRRGVIIGLFVLCGVIIFVAAVLTLGGQKKTFEKTFTVNAVFDDVSGLQAGNNVWFAGVKIGTVKKVELHSKVQVAVVMHIEQRSQLFIRRNAKAKIGSDGLIGNRIIIIYGGTPEAPAVAPGAFISVEKSEGTDDIIKTLQENNRNILAITGNFKMISEQMIAGKGTIGKLLADESLVSGLQSTVATLQQASLHAETLTSNLAGYSAKLQTKGTLAHEIVTDTTIIALLKATASQIHQVSKTVNDVAGNLKSTSSQLNEKGGAAGVLLNDPEAAAYLKTTLRNLQSGTEKLDENMEALQHNFLLRGYFKRNAKNKNKSVNISRAAPANDK